MEDALRTVEQLLRKYRHTYQANLAMIAREHLAQNPRQVCQELNDDEWWGGNDSIAAMDLAVDGGFSAEARADGQRLRTALIELYRTMKTYGEYHEQAELATSQFTKWLSSRI